MKKIIFILLMLVLLMNVTAFAATCEIQSVTCTAREDGLNDVSVVVKTDILYPELTLMVIGNDDNGAGEKITVDGKEGYIYYMIQEDNVSSLAYTFNFVMDIPETMIDIADYIYVFSGHYNAYEASQLNGFNYDLTFGISGNGTVTVRKEAVTDGELITVASGSGVDITVTPDAGYVVKTAALNGVGMIETYDGVYSTGVIGEDGIITVEFEKDTSVPDVEAYSVPYMENGTTSIVFATLTNTNLNYTLVKYGVVAGKTSDVKIGDEGSFDLVSKTSTNSKHQYGIKIVDNETNDYLGKNYFVVPYAIYTDGEEEKIYYSNAVEVNFDEE